MTFVIQRKNTISNTALEKLHNKSEDWSKSLGTTVYLLLNSIEELDS